jgi:hypothetical protein
MAALVAAIHFPETLEVRADRAASNANHFWKWMAGTSPAMTN